MPSYHREIRGTLPKHCWGSMQKIKKFTTWKTPKVHDLSTSNAVMGRGTVFIPLKFKHNIFFESHDSRGKTLLPHFLHLFIKNGDLHQDQTKNGVPRRHPKTKKDK